MKIAKVLLSLPKTIYFNFKVFPFRTARYLPIIISYNTKLYQVNKGSIILENRPHFGIIKYGWSEGSKGVPGVCEPCGWNVDKKSKVIFKGKANFSNGISIRCDSGEIVFGNNFICNKNCFFASSKRITFGENVLVGWNVNIRDVDGHNIHRKGGRRISNPPKEVVIGNHVWIASYVDILKGAIIPDDCVVAYRSCVINSQFEKNSIIGGYPARVLKNSIEWDA